MTTYEVKFNGHNCPNYVCYVNIYTLIIPKSDKIWQKMTKNHQNTNFSKKSDFTRKTDNAGFYPSRVLNFMRKKIVKVMKILLEKYKKGPKIGINGHFSPIFDLQWT